MLKIVLVDYYSGCSRMDARRVSKTSQATQTGQIHAGHERRRTMVPPCHRHANSIQLVPETCYRSVSPSSLRWRSPNEWSACGEQTHSLSGSRRPDSSSCRGLVSVVGHQQSRQPHVTERYLHRRSELVRLSPHLQGRRRQRHYCRRWRRRGKVCSASAGGPAGGDRLRLLVR